MQPPLPCGRARAMAVARSVAKWSTGAPLLSACSSSARAAPSPASSWFSSRALTSCSRLWAAVGSFRSSRARCASCGHTTGGTGQGADDRHPLHRVALPICRDCGLPPAAPGLKGCRLSGVQSLAPAHLLLHALQQQQPAVLGHHCIPGLRQGSQRSQCCLACLKQWDGRQGSEAAQGQRMGRWTYLLLVAEVGQRPRCQGPQQMQPARDGASTLVATALSRSACQPKGGVPNLLLCSLAARCTHRSRLLPAISSSCSCTSATPASRVRPCGSKGTRRR